MAIDPKKNIALHRYAARGICPPLMPLKTNQGLLKKRYFRKARSKPVSTKLRAQLRPLAVAGHENLSGPRKKISDPGGKIKAQAKKSDP